VLQLKIHRILMPCFCRVFHDFFSKYAVFFPLFCRDFLLSLFMINVYIAFVHSHMSYTADLYLNTHESSFNKLTKVE